MGMAWASRPVHVACCNGTSGGYDCMPVHAMREFVVPVIILGLGIAFEAFLAFHPQTAQSASHPLSHISEISSYNYNKEEGPLLLQAVYVALRVYVHIIPRRVLSCYPGLFSSVVSDKEDQSDFSSNHARGTLQAQPFDSLEARISDIFPS